METQIIKQQYFELRNFLNQANRFADEATDISFHIEFNGHYVFHAVSKGAMDMHRIALAEKIPRGSWERTGITTYTEFEEKCADLLNDEEENLNILPGVRKIDQTVLVRLSERVHHKLIMLMLGPLYEP